MPGTDDETDAIDILQSMRKELEECKQSQRALKESELLYRTLIETSPDAIIVVDVDTDVIIMANPQAALLGGLSTTDEIIGRTTLEFSYPDDIDLVKAYIREIRETGALRDKEQRIVRADGSVRIINVTATLLHDVNGQPTSYVSIIRDVTERRQAEEALRKNELLYRTLVETSPNGIIIVDPISGDIVMANKQAANLVGLDDPKDLVGRSGFDFSYPEDRELWEGYVREIMVSGGFKDKEHHVRRVDGSSRLATITATLLRGEQGEPPTYVSVITDITERKQAEETIRKNEQLYRTLVDTSPDAIIVVDIYTNNILMANQQAVAMGGLGNPEDLLGHNTAEFVHPEEIEQSQEANRLILETGGVRNRVNRIVRSDGSVIAVEYNATLLRDETGKPTSYISVLRDVTERRKAEQELNALYKELEERVAQRTAELASTNKELESFSYSVSHDLRAPLRSIDGFSQALLEDYEDKIDDRGKDYLHRVRVGAQRMGSLIDDMLRLSRVTRAEMHVEEIDLTALAEEVIQELHNEEPYRHVEVVIQDKIMAQADRSLLKILLENLLGNAWKFTGKIDNPRIEFGIIEHDKMPVYYVRDNGEGFDMSYVNKLFVPFQRLHAETEFPGSGIGLAIAQRVVHRHEGDIWAEAAPGQGATFYFSLWSAREKKGK